MKARQQTLDAIAAEVARAREKFPMPRHLTHALMEEVGEMTQALLQGRFEDAHAEAIQVAAVAVRIFEEGDRDFDADDEISRKP